MLYSSKYQPAYRAWACPTVQDGPTVAADWSGLMLVARPGSTIRPHVLTALTSRSLRGTLERSLQSDCTLCHTSNGVTAFVTAVRQPIDLVVLAEELLLRWGGAWHGTCPGCCGGRSRRRRRRF